MGIVAPVRVSQILETINHLKPMPASVTRILREIENPDVLIADVAGLIGMDQVLAALVLQEANSAALGYTSNCFLLQDAVMRIGLRRLKTVLLVSTSYQSMNGPLHGYRLGAGELWLHAQKTASACENLARLLHFRQVEEAYISGLLHDIGKLILNQVMLADYSHIATFISRYRMAPWEIEKKLIGIDHAQAGSLMAEHWNFPADLSESIHFHHYPSMAPINPVLPAIVNLANSAICQKPGSGDAEFGLDLAPETLNILGLDAAALPEISREISRPARRNV